MKKIIVLFISYSLAFLCEAQNVAIVDTSITRPIYISKLEDTNYFYLFASLWRTTREGKYQEYGNIPVLVDSMFINLMKEKGKKILYFETEEVNIEWINKTIKRDSLVLYKISGAQKLKDSVLYLRNNKNKPEILNNESKEDFNKRKVAWKEGKNNLDSMIEEYRKILLKNNKILIKERLSLSQKEGYFALTKQIFRQ